MASIIKQNKIARLIATCLAAFMAIALIPSIGGVDAAHATGQAYSAEIVLEVYRQVGNDGLPKIARGYTQTELDGLVDIRNNTGYLHGYRVYRTNNAVTLKRLVSDAMGGDAAFMADAKYEVADTNGSKPLATTLSYDELTAGSKFYPATTITGDNITSVVTDTDGAHAVEPALAMTATLDPIEGRAGHYVQNWDGDTSGPGSHTMQFLVGTSEENYLAKVSSGKRFVSGVDRITVIRYAEEAQAEIAGKFVEQAKAVEELQKKAEEMQKKADDSQKNAEDMQKKAEDSQKNAEGMQKKAEDSQKNAEEMQKKAEDSQKNAEGMQAKAEELQKKAEELQRKVEGLNGEVKRKEAAVADIQRSSGAGKAQMESDKARLENEKAKLAGEKAVLEKENADIKAKTEDMRAQIDASNQAAFKGVVAKISKLKAGKASVAVTWKKIDGAQGYQVVYSTNGKFTGKKTVSVSGASAVKNTVKNLKKGGTYYFKVRGYAKIGGKLVYTQYAPAKKVKIKK
jgi:predicted  nucleic acid-binding Zn-ribbon protein